MKINEISPSYLHECVLPKCNEALNKMALNKKLMLVWVVNY